MRSEEYRYQIENAPDSSVIETRDGSLFIMKKDLDVQGGKMLVFTGTHLVNGYNPRSYSMDYRVVAAVYRPYDPLYVEKKNAFFKERDEFFLISNQR